MYLLYRKVAKMAKIYLDETDRRHMRKVRALHGELLAEGIHDAQIGEWLGCTSQNVSQKWKRGSFTWREHDIIKQKLEEVRKKNEILV